MLEGHKAINIEPIGYVRNKFQENVPEGYENICSEIVILEKFSEGLYKIEGNSHLVVIFWMDRIEDEARNVMKMHPKGREDLPLLGVFSTRSPRRPNPMGVRAVRLLNREKNIIKVEGLDALNGSPVLDIKPYSLKHDLVKDAKAPWWARNIQEKEGDPL